MVQPSDQPASPARQTWNVAGSSVVYTSLDNFQAAVCKKKAKATVGYWQKADVLDRDRNNVFLKCVECNVALHSRIGTHLRGCRVVCIALHCGVVSLSWQYVILRSALQP